MSDSEQPNQASLEQDRPGAAPADSGRAVDAAAQIASGAVQGGWAGAGKAAAKLAVQSPKGRKLMFAGIAGALLGPIGLMMAMVMIVSTLTSTGLAAGNKAADSSSMELVKQVGFSDDEMTAITNASAAAGIQWQVLAAVLDAEQWASDGEGPYHVTATLMPWDRTDLDDVVQASHWVATRIRDGLNGRWVNAALDIGTGGTVYSDQTIEWADPEAHKTQIVEPYMEVLGALPVDGADEDWGKQVIEQAVNWRLGIIDTDMAYCAPEGETLTVSSSNGQTVTLNSKQLGYAAIIYNEGQRAGVNDNAIQSALMTVMVETHYQNLASEKQPGSEKFPNDGVAKGDHLSIGLFQQQPWWGSMKERMDPAYAARAYYGKAGLKGVPGVLQISGWQDMDPGKLAQAVQRSAGGWYYLWKQAGAEILAKVQGITCDMSDFSGSWAEVIAFANSKVGKWMYSWGGGGLNGPSYGIGPGRHVFGFDCSGFVQFVVYQGSGKRVALPGDSRSQARWAKSKGVLHRTSNWKELKPGDIVFFSRGSSIGSIYHVALVVAPGVIDEAPGTGRPMQQNKIVNRMPYDIWGYARFDLLKLANR